MAKKRRTAKQKAASKRNIKKAQAARRKKRHSKKRRGTSGVAGLVDKLTTVGRFKAKGRSYKIVRATRPKRRKHRGGRKKKSA